MTRIRQQKVWIAIGVAALAAGLVPSARSSAADVDEPSAREVAARIAPRVEALRGLNFLRPVPVQVVDADHAVRLLLERIAAFQPREQLDRTCRAYELLGLLPAGFDLLGTVADWMRGDVGGFYDPPSGSLFVIDRGSIAHRPLVIAHELTHALEDQHFDIDARQRDAMDDDDRSLALAAVREGSAVRLASVLALSDADSGLGLDADRSAGGEDPGGSDARVALPPVLLRQFLAPYVLGPLFLAAGAGRDGAPAEYRAEVIDRAWLDPPRSTEQILHPEKYWSEATRDTPRAVDLGQAGSALGRGFVRTMHGTLGELTLGTLVGAPPPDGAGGEWSVAASSGWGGDRWELWERGDTAVVLLGILWDTPGDAREFADALPTDTGLRWRVRGDAAALVAGDAGRRAERVLERALRHLTRPLVPER